MERLHYKFKDFSNDYNILIGDTPFNNTVNKMISDYWVLTGEEMPLEDAMFAVLADFFNKNSNKI